MWVAFLESGGMLRFFFLIVTLSSHLSCKSAGFLVKRQSRSASEVENTPCTPHHSDFHSTHALFLLFWTWAKFHEQNMHYQKTYFSLEQNINYYDKPDYFLLLYGQITLSRSKHLPRSLSVVLSWCISELQYSQAKHFLPGADQLTWGQDMLLQDTHGGITTYWHQYSLT